MVLAIQHQIELVEIAVNQSVVRQLHDELHALIEEGRHIVHGVTLLAKEKCMSVS